MVACIRNLIEGLWWWFLLPGGGNEIAIGNFNAVGHRTNMFYAVQTFVKIF